MARRFLLSIFDLLFDLCVAGWEMTFQRFGGFCSHLDLFVILTDLLTWESTSSRKMGSKYIGDAEGLSLAKWGFSPLWALWFKLF